MKAGIITYYNAINEGAFLQAFCLKSFIEENISCEVFFVPNIKTDINKKQRKQLLRSKNPMVLIVNFNRIFASKKAKDKHFSIGVPAQKYDFVIVGSDEMWNVKNSAFSDYNIALDIETPIKISYAVSMGNFEGRLSEGAIKEIAKFSGLSVRDDNSKAVLCASGFSESKIHLDPVFLYPILSEMPAIRYKFILIYGAITDIASINKIRRHAAENNLKTISLDIYNKWCDVKVAAKSPFEFVGYIDKADLIITNMFHGTMLSVVRNKEFISIQTPRRKKKVEYASRRLLFHKRCVEESSNWNIEEVLKNELDYTAINKIIEKERCDAREYFMNVLCENNMGEKVPHAD